MQYHNTNMHWERERVYAEEECWKADRERALRDIILLMRCYEISTAELVLILQGADAECASGAGRRDCGCAHLVA